MHSSMVQCGQLMTTYVKVKDNELGLWKGIKDSGIMTLYSIFTTC